MRFVVVLVFLYVNLAVASTLSVMYLPGGWLGNLAVTLVLAFFAVLAHELGHALVAHRLGAVVQSILVLIFHLRLRPRKLTLVPPRGLGDLGGHVTYTFVDRWWTIRKEAIVAAAGPAANFALAIVAALAAAGLAEVGAVTRPRMVFDGTVFVIHGPSFFGPQGIAATLATALAILSAGMGFANLIPFPGSDGQQILRFLFPRRR